MKIMWVKIPSTKIQVAPCAGAWVEKVSLLGGGLGDMVAPCAGAWVENSSMGDLLLNICSRPLCGGVG